MAEYKVVEVTQLEGPLAEIPAEQISSVLSEYCPAGWEIMSARTLAENGIQRSLVVLTR